MHSEHRNATCDHGEITCGFCNEEIIRIDSVDHIVVCPKSIIKCLNCNENVQKDQEATHLLVYPELVVKCRFFDDGCQQFFQLKNQNDHYKNIDHTNFMYTKIIEEVKELKIMLNKQLANQYNVITQIFENSHKEIYKFEKGEWRINVDYNQVSESSIIPLKEFSFRFSFNPASNSTYSVISIHEINNKDVEVSVLCRIIISNSSKSSYLSGRLRNGSSLSLNIVPESISNESFGWMTINREIIIKFEITIFKQ